MLRLVRAPGGSSASKLDRLAGSLFGVATSEPVFALTFDDGPNQADTPAVLDALAASDARATFFVLTCRVAQARRVVDDLIAAGHEIALHGDTHLDLTRSSPRKLISDIRGARDRLEQLIGQEVRFFRPPYGTQSLLSYVVARVSGLEVVAWSSSARDFFALELDRHVQVAVEELEPGGIMLLHDGGGSVPTRRRKLVELLLTQAAAHGLEPVTVSQLLSSGEPIRRLWLRRRAEALLDEVEPFLLHDRRA
jgi:peptidoglycan-N-acetylglucosamine deacetylase